LPTLYLLCHATETSRPTNTGQLVPAALNAVTGTKWQVHTIPWSRVAPDPLLLADIARQPLVLLYPSAQATVVQLGSEPQEWSGELSSPVSEPPLPAGFILLDATWQQARKMYNQSPYLQQLPHWQGQADYQSVFCLRRNQRAGGWCTAETVALLWQYCGALAEAGQLWQLFHQFNQR
jgi:DTW domain-containing protein YfiP